MAQNQTVKFWDNPYYAPLTDPLKNVAAITRLGMGNFFERLRTGWENEAGLYGRGQNSSKLLSMLDALGSSPNSITAIPSFLGAIAGGIAGAIVGGTKVYGGMAAAGTLVQWGATCIAALATGAAGVLAGPVVALGITTAVAAVVGCAIGIVPGVIGGTVKAAKHYIQQKNAPKVAAANAAANAALNVHIANGATPADSQRIFDIVNIFRNMRKESHPALFEELAKAGGDMPQTSAPDKIIAAIQNLPDAERVAVIESLQEKLASDFGAVAAKKANAVHEGGLEVYKSPIRLKGKNKPATTAGNN